MRVEGQQDHAQVADGRGVDDVAADGGAVAHLGGGDLAQETGQRREGGGDQRRLHQAGDGGGGADEEAVGGRPDPGEAVSMRQQAQLALGQLGPALHKQVGAAGHDHGVGRLPLRRRLGWEFAELRRDPGKVSRDDAPPDEGVQPAFRAGGESGGPRLAQKPLDGPADGGIAGAAADVALDGADGVLRLQGRVLEQETGQADDQPRGAEAALARPLADEILLHRRQAVVVQPFDGDHVAAGNVAEGEQAGGDGAVADAPVLQTAQQDGAGAAVALAATDPRAGQALPVAQEVDQGGAGRQRRAHLAAVEQEGDAGGHSAPQRPAAVIQAMSAQQPRDQAAASGANRGLRASQRGSSQRSSRLPRA